MSDERRGYVHRQPWPWWQRASLGLVRWPYQFFVQPFLITKPDGTTEGSMPAWAVFGFSLVEIVRLWPVRMPDGGLSFAPVGFADALMVFFILFAIPIHEALTTVAQKNPDKIVDAIADAVSSRVGNGNGGGYASVWAVPAAMPASDALDGPGTLRADQLQAPVSHGRPDDEGV